MCVKVVEVKKDYDDLTMSLPCQILGSLNADFDGDVLNIVALKGNDFKKKFDEIFNPRNSLFVSRNDGLFNDDCNLLKDQAIGIYEFCNI